MQRSKLLIYTKKNNIKKQFISLQKIQTPDINDLPAPPLESEYKAGSGNKLKTQNLTVVEAGTSVVPRQRPRGIALGLPPSPSPRNTTSPQPHVFCSELFQSAAGAGAATTEQKLSNSFAEESQEGRSVSKGGHRRNVSDTIALNR